MLSNSGLAAHYWKINTRETGKCWFKKKKGKLLLIRKLAIWEDGVLFLAKNTKIQLGLASF